MCVCFFFWFSFFFFAFHKNPQDSPLSKSVLAVCVSVKSFQVFFLSFLYIAIWVKFVFHADCRNGTIQNLILAEFYSFRVFEVWFLCFCCWVWVLWFFFSFSIFFATFAFSKRETMVPFIMLFDDGCEGGKISSRKIVICNLGEIC